MDDRKEPWKKSIALSPIATVIPEKVTARPDVRMLAISANSGVRPADISSRNRLTMKSE